jgi:DNA-binding CsgD family transcriptional regulator
MGPVTARLHGDTLDWFTSPEGNPMSEHWRIALALSLDMATVRSFYDYLVAVTKIFDLHLPADDAFWLNGDRNAGTVAVRRVSGADPELADALLSHSCDHPGICSCFAVPADLAPRRISDLAQDATWHRTRAYQRIFRSRKANYQLCIVAGVDAPGRGRGWMLSRQSSDFSDDELDVARCLTPVIALSSLRWYSSGAPPPRIVLRGTSALTDRERQVLSLLAEGLTAAAIARRLGVTSRTVRKHLERVYDKLDAHDRLVAVERARSMGLLGRPPDRGNVEHARRHGSPAQAVDVSERVPLTRAPPGTARSSSRTPRR